MTGGSRMQDILSFVNDLQAAYEQQSDELKALIKPPKLVQARNFERYVINLYKYLDSKQHLTEQQQALFKLVNAFMVDYDGAYS